MRWTVVGEMNEMDCELKEIKMKHDQWSVDSMKWDETWTMRCGLVEIRWNMNNEVNNMTSTSFCLTTLQVGQNVSNGPKMVFHAKLYLPPYLAILEKFFHISKAGENRQQLFSKAEGIAVEN